MQQNELEGGRLVSCGPIVLEVMVNIITCYTCDDIRALWRNSNDISLTHHSIESKAIYKKISIERLLPNHLLELTHYTLPSRP